MKWGFGWQQGPFEIWDAIGVEKSVEKMKEEGREIPAFVQAYSIKGLNLSIKKKMEIFITSMEMTTQLVPVNEKVIDLKRYKKKHGVIKNKFRCKFNRFWGWSCTY